MNDPRIAAPALQVLPAPSTTPAAEPPPPPLPREERVSVLGELARARAARRAPMAGVPIARIALRRVLRRRVPEPDEG